MLKKYLKKHPIMILLSLILVTIQVFTFIFQPQLSQWIIEELSKADLNAIDMGKINNYGVGLLTVGIISLISGIFNTIVAAKLAQEIGAEMRDDGFRNIQNLAFADIEKFTTSNLVVRLTNDVTQIQNLLMMGLQMVLRVPIIFVGAFVMAVLQLPDLWWTIILYVIIVAFITMMLMKSNGPRFGLIQKAKDKLNTIIKENLDGVRVVKSFGTEEKEAQKYEATNEEMTQNYWKVGRAFSILIPSFMFIANIVIMISLIYVSKTNSLGEISKVASYMQYTMQLMFSILMAGMLGMTVGMGAASLQRMGEVLNAKPSIKSGDQVLNDIQTLEFKDVSFKYENEDEYTLKNISFKIAKGEKVGVVGSTGSGKTTLVQLIPRLYDVTEGEIIINDIPIDKFTLKSLRNKISIVLQKAQLFSGTIKDVILQGNMKANDFDIEVAAKRAQALEFIEKKDGKFEGEVYQKGANFSGGQKQRLSIARGLAKNPNILILDDSTSALDARSENLVKKVIDEELTGVTTLIVSQKISSVVNTDKIIVLADGKIDAIGTHKELVQNSAVYREIYDTQKGKEV